MNVIRTKAMGMVGEGVLPECLNNPAVTKVLVICRNQAELTRYPKQVPKVDDIIK